MTLLARLGVQYTGLLADRPETAKAGDTFYATDTKVGYVWNGATSAWDTMGAGGAGGADVFDVTSYGAKGDGTTDDTTAINAALTALKTRGRGRLYFPHGVAGVYLTSSQIDLQTPAARPDIAVYCEPGVCIKPNADFVAFKVKQDNLGGTAFNGLGIMPMCIIERLNVQPATSGQATGIVIEDSYGVILGQVEMRDLKVGIHMRTYNSWSEGWVFEDVLIDACTTGLLFEKAAGGTPAGTGSFQAGHARRLHIRNGLRCAEIGEGVVVSNCLFEALQFWVAQTNGAVGIYIDGNVDKTEFNGLFEAQGAAAGTRYAWEFGSHAVYCDRMVMAITWFPGYVYWSGGNEFGGAVNNPYGILWIYSPPPNRPNISPSTTMIIDGTADGDYSKSTPYTGTINAKADATHITYNDPSAQEGCLGPNQVLRNTTRNTKAKIVSVNRTNNTIVLEAASPQDATNWQVNDAITTKSAVNTGRSNTFVDYDVTAWVTREGVAAIYQLSVKFISGTGESFIILHPWEAYDEAKEFATIQCQAFWQYQTGFGKMRWEGKRAYITGWLLVGASTVIRPNVRYVGQM